MKVVVAGRVWTSPDCAVPDWLDPDWLDDDDVVV